MHKPPKIRKDYTGCRFGKLTVLKFDRHQCKKGNHRIWLCQCECGKKIRSLIGPLKDGFRENCGECVGPKLKKDYAGQKFGDIKILSFERYATGDSGRKKDSMWLCECSCGEKFVRRIRTIKKGKSKCKKCSCKRGQEHPCWRGHGEISKDLYNSYLNSAIKRNLEFSITIEYMWNLFLKQNKRCALTGWEIYFPATYRTKTQKTASPDRIDSQKGYIEGNIQWIHQDINYLKSNIESEYFLKMCKAVANQSTNE